MFKLSVCIVNLFIIFAVSLIDLTVDQITPIIYIQLIVNVVAIIALQKTIFTVGVTFYFLVSLFHLSAILVDTSLFSQIDDEILIEAISFSISSLSLFTIGYFINATQLVRVVDVPEQYVIKIRKTAAILLAITIAPAIYIDVVYIITSYADGYGAIYSLAERNPMLDKIGLVARFARPACLLLLFTYYNDTRKGKFIFLLFIAYSFVVMLSGMRALNVVYIAAATLIYGRLFVSKINYKAIILFLGLVGCLVVVLPLISRLRGTELSIDNVQSINENSMEDGYLTAVFQEFGYTMISLINSIQYTPPNYNYGITYLLGWTSISPILPVGLIDTTNYAFTDSFPGNVRFGLGGSILGELYYNFGYYGFVFFSIVGAFVARVDKFIYNINNKNLLTTILCISILPFLLLWVRDFFVVMIFIPFWIYWLMKFRLKK